jgi:Ca-activated chloride channel family protein
MMASLETFHFLRPEWLWALLPLLLLVALLARDKAKGGNWQSVVDPQLLPHLLIGESVRQRRWPLAILTLAGALAITALAGPVWQKLEQPLFRQDSSLVILLDLSRSMDATDSKPSRLARAKLKLKDILERRHEGETALIVYAANAFVVTPLTSDTRTIASQLSGLTTDLMPTQGSRPDLALDKGRDLLREAGRVSGSLLVVGDGVEGAPAAAFAEKVEQLRAEGYQLLLLGVGSIEGAPIPLPGGGFVKDGAGNIVLAALDTAQMETAARSGGGIYRQLTTDDSDIEALIAVIDAKQSMDKGDAIEGMVSDQWQEEGAWLLLPLLFIALFAFRRGVLLLALVAVLPLPREGMAAGLDEIWFNRDQQAQQAFEKGDSKAAAELYEDPAWRAAALYKSGDYPKTLEALEGIAGSAAAYNRGNALAQQGKLDEALKAYEEALKQEPTMADAAFNRGKVKEWLKESPQQGKQGEPGESDQPSDEQGEGQEGEPQAEPSPSDQSSPGEKKPGEEEASSPPQDGEQNADDKQNEAIDSQPDDKSAGEEGSAATPDEEKAAQQAAQKQLAEQLSKEKTETPDDEGHPATETVTPQSSEQRELEQATEQWLRRIPDDPSGLWRRKFMYQYKNQEQSRGKEERPW